MGAGFIFSSDGGFPKLLQISFATSFRFFIFFFLVDESIFLRQFSAFSVVDNRHGYSGTKMATATLQRLNPRVQGVCRLKKEKKEHSRSSVIGIGVGLPCLLRLVFFLTPLCMAFLWIRDGVMSNGVTNRWSKSLARQKSMKLCHDMNYMCLYVYT